MFYLSQMCCVCEAWNCEFFDILSTNDGDLKLIDKLKHCVPELELLSTEHTRYICQSCNDNLDIVFQFKLMCIKTHQNLNIYAEKLKINNESKSAELKIDGDFQMKNELKGITLPEELVTVYRVEVIKELDEQDENNIIQGDLNLLRQDLNNMISEIPVLNDKITNISTTTSIIKQKTLSNKMFLTVNDNDKRTNACNISNQKDSAFTKEKNSTENNPIDKENLVKNGVIPGNEHPENISQNVENQNKSLVTSEKEHIDSISKNKEKRKKSFVTNEKECIKNIPENKENQNKQNNIIDGKNVENKDKEKRNSRTGIKKTLKDLLRRPVRNFMLANGNNLHGFCTGEIHKSVIEIKKTVSAINELDKNILEHKSLFGNTTEIISDISDDNFSCTICNKQFSKIIDLNTHNEIAHKTTYICLICMKFVNNNLKAHLETHFSQKQKYYFCKKCKIRFSTKYDINEHNLKHHNNKKFYCQICDKVFLHKHLLNQHQLLNHDKSNKHTCKICYKSFRIYSHLKRHNYVHDKTNRPFKCDFCSKTFCFKDALKKHIYSHTNEKPYSCILCDKKYTRKETLKDHVAMYHNNQPNKQKTYTCTICDKNFKMFKDFKLHRKIHRYETPFGCIICGKNFRIEAQLNYHITNHLLD